MKQKGILESHHHFGNHTFELNNLIFDSSSVKVQCLVKLSCPCSFTKGKRCPDLQKNCCCRFSAPLEASLPTLHYLMSRFLGSREKVVPLPKIFSQAILDLGHVSTERLTPYQLTSANHRLLKTL